MKKDNEYLLELTIPGLPLMMNELLRGNWTRKHGHARQWKLLITRYVYNQRPVEPLQSAMLTLTRHSSKEPDYDGLVSSFKHVVDGLVVAKIIIDDTQSVIGIPKYKWEKCSPRKGHIKIIVTNG